MRRTHGVAAMVVGALVVLATFAVFAVGISSNQSESRRSLESQAHQRAELVSGLMDAVFRQRARLGPEELAGLGTPIVPAHALERLRGQDDYVVLLDGSGRILAHSAGLNGQGRHAVLTGAALRLVRQGHPWSLGNIFPYKRVGVIDFAERLNTAQGERILVTGVPLDSLTALTHDELRRVPGVIDQHQLMIDGNGVVVGSTVADRPAGYRLHTASQMSALAHGAGVVHGSNGVRWFDTVPLANTTWRLILTVPAGQFFAGVSGFRHWLPWIILAAFGLVAIAVLLLVGRAILVSERLRATNAQLVTANVDLGAARSSLQESNEALADSNGALGRSNTALERQARELVRSNNELDQFASVASHDLQEPLRKIRTFTERISATEAGNLSERGSDYLRRANASAERMQILIEDLLRFSRVSTQSRPFVAVDLETVTAGVLDDLHEQVSRDGAQLTVGPLPTINADPSQMRQLVQNLISNALKFRREGVTPEVRVAVVVDAGWMTLTVADNGIGFDPQYASRIFRVFERLHGRGAYPGTGIGLALCRKIAARHGGTIAAHGVPGEGATFVVTLQTDRAEPVGEADGGAPFATGPQARQEPYVTA